MYKHMIIEAHQAVGAKSGVGREWADKSNLTEGNLESESILRPAGTYRWRSRTSFNRS